MDVVTDLSSQCVSFITIYQELCKKALSPDEQPSADFHFFAQLSKSLKIDHSWFNDGLRARVEEVVWSSTKEVIHNDRLEHFFEHCRAIMEWLEDYQEKNPAMALGGLYSTPYQWRSFIRTVLYHDKEQRAELSGILEYMPIQIIWCLGGGVFDLMQQRLLQIWRTDHKEKVFQKQRRLFDICKTGCKLNALSHDDDEFNRTWWEGEFDSKNAPSSGEDGDLQDSTKPRDSLAKEILGDDKKILKLLLKNESPVPFETIFSDELDEIEKSRKTRHEIRAPEKIWIDIKPADDIADPTERAAVMDLYGLTFSGGGIRSATFGLGILQKLAEMGILGRFDYISTVSGGGYIGSWLESWIQRSGSMSKVMDRLSHEKSADPLSDEVRPIRWLRMFSNYLAPDAGAMSADSWTMGITVFRNTLLNQVVLFLFFCSGLALVKGIFYIWDGLLRHFFINGPYLDIWRVTGLSAAMLIPVAVFAGWGMHAYNPEHPPKSLNLEKTNWLYVFLVIWAALSTFYLSALMYGKPGLPFNLKMRQLEPVVLVGFVALLVVAYVGAYQKSNPGQKKLSKMYVWIIVSSAIASVGGFCLLGGCWQLLEDIYNDCNLSLNGSQSRVAFILGLPMLLEAISITVVIRMAIMGNLFPDIRREWWGRMGALIHRFIFIWLLVSFCGLLLPQIIRSYVTSLSNHLPAILTMFGGWSVVIGYAVKLAFGPKVSGQNTKDGSTSAAEIFVGVAPYLFAVGLLFLCSILLGYLQNIVSAWEFLQKPGPVLVSGVLVVACGLLTFFLSWRIGINEFSLHHFYRNRLCRAYMGATRRREDRDRTANNFTNFDEKDDILLTEFTTTNHYNGPYPILNCTLNSSVVTNGSLDKQDRKGESFVFTPKYCGYDFCRNRPSPNSPDSPYEYGYRPTNKYGYPGGTSLSTAMAISGAAVDPDMGYHTSPGISFLLTVFNVRLGRWMGNPRKDKWKRADPKLGLFYMLKDLVGNSDINSDYVCLTDGGHFDNMGVYELVRRRCKHILVCDGEQDGDSSCEGFATAIRRCRIDFGVEININTSDITTKDSITTFSKQHFSQGTINYPGDIVPSGSIIYVKTSLTGNETVDIRQYYLTNNTFPQQSTGDQFFDESQFESYRKLGYMSLTHYNNKGVGEDDYITKHL